MANQELVFQIVTMGMGFEVEAITEALIAVGNSSTEAAINFLVTKQSSAHDAVMYSSTEPHSESSSVIDELKEKFRNLDLNIPNDKVHEALQRNNNNPHQAFEWIMNELTHGRISDENETAAAGAVRPIRSREDAEEIKQRMAVKAEERRQQQAEDERNRLVAMEDEKQQFEAESKEREERAAIHAAAVRANRDKVANAKKQKSKKVDARRLEWHSRHDEFDRNDAAKLASVRTNREAAEADLNSGEDCVRILFDRYGEDLVISILQLLRKAVAKVIQNVDVEKFRRIDLNGKKAAALLATPLGAARFLKLLGFEDDLDNNLLILSRERCDEEALNNALALLDSYLSFEDSPVVGCVQRCEEEKCDLQDLFFALQVTHDYLRNILISPTNSHLTLVPVDDPHFRNNVGKFPAFIRLFKTLGFKLVTRPDGRYLSIEIDRSHQLNTSTHPQLRVLKAAVRDCGLICRRLIHQTHVVLCVDELRPRNVSSRAMLEKLFAFVLKSMQRVMDEPLEFRYHKLNVDKLRNKFHGVIGILDVVKVAGYSNEYTETNASGTHTFVALDSPIDFELLKFKRNLLVHAVNNRRAVVPA